MKVPLLGDLDLAYETGLHIGDGCLSHYPPHRYRYAISGNLRTEKEYYNQVIVPLIRKLYGLTASVYCYRNSIYAIVNSKTLLLFKQRQIGLPVGVKDDLKHLPLQILEKGEANVAALLSGLYDADGSVKVRRTSSGDYPRISFAQKTKTIVEDVQTILRSNFGITSTMYRNDFFDPRVRKTEVRWFLDVNGSSNFRLFQSSIGTRHPYVRKRISRAQIAWDESH